MNLKDHIDPSDLIIYASVKAGTIKGYTKFNRIMYVIKRKLEKKKYIVDIDFDTIFFGGPFSTKVWKTIDSLGSGSFISLDDVGASHYISPGTLAKMKYKYIEKEFKEVMGENTLDRIGKTISSLNKKKVMSIDNYISKLYPEAIVKRTVPHDSVSPRTLRLIRTA